jgi:hypothetical protein
MNVCFFHNLKFRFKGVDNPLFGSLFNTVYFEIFELFIIDFDVINSVINEQQHLD